MKVEVRMRRTVNLVALLLSLTFAAPATYGQGEARKLSAKVLYDQARQLQQQGQHRDALSVFDEAYRAFGDPIVLFFKAESLLALKEYDEARAVYVLVLQFPDKLGQKNTEAARANLGACESALKKTVVTFTTNVEGAVIELDGKLLGRAPLAESLPRGTYKARAEKDGRTSSVVTVTVAGEPKLSVTLSLPTTTVVTTGKPETRPIVTESAPSARPDRTWAWVTMGTGVALAAGGLAFLGNHLYYRTRSLGSNQHLEGGPLDLALGASLTGLGLAALGTGIYLLVKEPAKTTVNVVPLERGGLVTFGGGLR